MEHQQQSSSSPMDDKPIEGTTSRTDVQDIETSNQESGQIEKAPTNEG